MKIDLREKQNWFIDVNFCVFNAQIGRDEMFDGNNHN